MLLNWSRELRNIDPSIDFRATGGWLKNVTGLDKTVTNGYSIEGNFVKAGDYPEEIENGLYLDCNKEGKKSKPKSDYRLIRVQNGTLSLIDVVYDGRKNWAVDLWDSIAEELNENYVEDESDYIISMILNKTGKNLQLLEEVNRKLESKIKEFQ